eukprot:3125079-Prymnesium_polylepis.1
MPSQEYHFVTEGEAGLKHLAKRISSASKGLIDNGKKFPVETNHSVFHANFEKWKNVGSTVPPDGEILPTANPESLEKLADKLRTTSTIKKEEWKDIGIPKDELRMHHYVKCGDDYWQPSEMDTKNGPQPRHAKGAVANSRAAHVCRPSHPRSLSRCVLNRFAAYSELEDKLYEKNELLQEVR